MDIEYDMSCYNMAGEISNIMDSSLNEEQTQCVGLPQTVVSVGVDECKNSVFAVIYGGGLIYAQSFRIAMLRATRLNLLRCTIWKLGIFHYMKDLGTSIISTSYSIHGIQSQNHNGRFFILLILITSFLIFSLSVIHLRQHSN